ncbi:MAG: deoxyguanosinetriphosphate triphosphohydrolase, partial [Oscillospiraceae bacterium]|nr:deoxyguanosinetriphosphate triphosphohydrolase [Oscillospiraceae bacterium]
RHNEQSLRVVDRLERGGRGLNLTAEVRDGILCHTGGKQAETLEGRVVRLADRAAYINHDSDDAARAGLLTEAELPREITCALGDTCSRRIDTITRDVVSESAKTGSIAMSPQIHFAFDSFYSFMFENLYKNVRAKSEETKVFGILDGLFGYYVDNPDKLPDDYGEIARTEGLSRAVCDYISGMTDTYALYQFDELFIPNAWR